MSEIKPLVVTAVAASAQLGGTERVLLDFANRAFEHEIALRVLTPRDGPLVDILNKIGVPTEVVPASRAMLTGSQREGALWTLPGAVLGLMGWSRKLREHRFINEAKVIYTVAFKTHFAAAVARLHPVVWHLHEFPPTMTGRMWQMMAKRVPDHMIAVSEAIGDAWADPGEDEAGKREAGSGKGTTGGHWNRWRSRWGQVEPPPITVVRNGVNLDRFKPRERTYWIHERLGIPREHRIIGMPAVFARWKGQLEVIEAFSRICDDFPDTHLVIIGGSIYDTAAEREYGEELLKTTGEWGLARGTALGSGEWGPISELTGGEHGTPPSWRDAGKRDPDAERVPAEAARLQRVHLMPFQREIELAYPDFELAVHYSLRPEPFGRVVLEAMACGVPIIAAAEGGPLEIVGDGIGPRREAGWLAEPRNPDELARVMASALSLPREVLQSVGAAGRRRAEDEFSSRHFSGNVAQVLKAVGGAVAR